MINKDAIKKLGIILIVCLIGAMSGGAGGAWVARDACEQQASAQWISKVTSLDVSGGNITDAGNVELDSITNAGGITTTITAANGPVLVTQNNAYPAFRVDDVAGDTTPFIIDASGNVGIGTTGPTSALSFPTGSHIGIATADASDNGYLTLGGGGVYGTNRGANIILSGNERATYGGELDIRAGNVNPTGIIFFRTGATDKMVIDYNGNVGIGTTGPQVKTVVSGTLGIGFIPTAPTNGPTMLVIASQATTPTMAAGTAGLFVNYGELKGIDQDEHVSLLTPHPDELEGRIGYKSCNMVTGQCVLIDVEAMAADMQAGITGGSYITYTHIPEADVISWYDSQQVFAEQENARRMAEAAAVLVEVSQVDAVESYMQTVTQPVSPTQYITTTTTAWEFDAETGEAVAREAVTVEAITETVEVGLAWRLNGGCQLVAETGAFMCPTGEENATYTPYEAQPMPDWMQDRVTTIFLAPKNLNGIEKPEGEYKKLVDVGAYSIWWARAEVETLKGLHDTLWAMSPVKTLGALAAVKTRGESFWDRRVQKAIGATDAEMLARRNRIAAYLDSLGKNTSALRAATTEHDVVVAIVEALGYTMQQLWEAM